MIDPKHEVSITRQAELLGISRAAVYYVPRPISEEDLELIQRMIRRHFSYTRSKRADEVLRKWNTFAPRFVKVYPRDYKRAQSERVAAESGNG